ncbi:hypothetical protein Goshw_022465 [Gossypium schwendimanii]|uniref:Uncharacterized protein n=1 Tax=Gossypium schwendimanii TaxID=34291 RepID=A0A7J9LXT5_GOSSC|nr:hypothetical protein [Gossypium schwendimanii]
MYRQSLSMLQRYLLEICYGLWPGEDKTDGVLSLANLNANVPFKDTISSKAAATHSVGLRIQGISGLLIRAPSPTVHRSEAPYQQAKGTSITHLEKLDITILNSKFHSAIKFIENQNPNFPSSDMSSGASSSSLKFGDRKWLKRGSHNLRGKGSKFKVKALGRESVAKAMSRVVEKIGSYSLIANSNNS